MTRPYSAEASKSKDERWLLDEKYGGHETAEYEEDKKRLALGEPTAYIIGWQPFLGLKIYLDSKPLIPRSETEWWTEQLLNEIRGASQRREPAEQFSAVRLGRAARSAAENCSGGERQIHFLDLCAGSGAIGCAALACLPNAHVYFGEIDPAHEATILKNIRENDLDESRAFVRIGNLFSAVGGPASGGEPVKFDVIAVNPPYVPTDRILPASVTDYEPALALLAGKDGLDSIRRIAIELPKYLAKSGVAWIECDHGHAEDARALFETHDFHAEIRTDQYGVPRIVVVSFP